MVGQDSRVELIRNCLFSYFSEIACTYFLVVRKGKKRHIILLHENPIFGKFSRKYVRSNPNSWTDRARDVDDERPGHFRTCLI